MRTQIENKTFFNTKMRMISHTETARPAFFASSAFCISSWYSAAVNYGWTSVLKEILPEWIYFPVSASTNNQGYKISTFKVSGSFMSVEIAFVSLNVI